MRPGEYVRRYGARPEDVHIEMALQEDNRICSSAEDE